jgi:nucleotide-binding universal stress UspA family protein
MDDALCMLKIKEYLCDDVFCCRGREGRMSLSTQGGDRKIAIAVDLSDESAYAVKWAVANYLRPDDQVIILHVRPTSVLYGADWGASDQVLETDKESQQKMEDDFDALTVSKSSDLAKPLLDARIPFKIHIVKDHDMKERICLEVERLGANAVIMGSRGKAQPASSYVHLS